MLLRGRKKKVGKLIDTIQYYTAGEGVIVVVGFSFIRSEREREKGVALCNQLSLWLFSR